MIKEIDYKNKKLCYSVAGKKYPNQSGIIFELQGNRVDIFAKNPKLSSKTTGLLMQFPIEEIDNIIEALKDIKNGNRI